MAHAHPIDIHQHVWPVELLWALAGRGDGPSARPRDARHWTLSLPGEPDSTVLADDAERLRDRALAARGDGVRRALLVPPVTLGLEHHAAIEEAEVLLDTWHRAAVAAGGPFGHWAAVDPRVADPATLAARLDAGAFGLCLPAGALADPSAVERVGRLLQLLEERDLPLMVHPGATPAPAGGAPAAWWPAIADYVPQLVRAWGTLLAVLPASHPRLRTCLVALGGGAPLLLERLQARGGPALGAADDRWFYETSSFGPRAIAHAAEAVGAERLVFGSDRPVLDGGAALGPDLDLHAGATALLGPGAAHPPAPAPRPTTTVTA